MRLLKKGRKGRRNRLKGTRGRGTLEKEKPPIFGMIQRGGQVVIRMLDNVQQKTIKPLIEAVISPGTLVFTDEYSIYCRLEESGDIATSLLVMERANMRGMKTVMGFTKFM